MLTQCLPGILIPFAGTTLGSACVFFMKKTVMAAPLWKHFYEGLTQAQQSGKE